MCGRIQGRSVLSGPHLVSRGQGYAPPSFLNGLFVQPFLRTDCCSLFFSSYAFPPLPPARTTLLPNPPVLSFCLRPTSISLSRIGSSAPHPSPCGCGASAPASFLTSHVNRQRPQHPNHSFPSIGASPSFPLGRLAHFMFAAVARAPPRCSQAQRCALLSALLCW